MNCNYCIIKRISALYDMFDKETKNCIIKSEAAEMPLCQDHGVGKFPAPFKLSTAHLCYRKLFKICMMNDKGRVLDLVTGTSYNIY